MVARRFQFSRAPPPAVESAAPTARRARPTEIVAIVTLTDRRLARTLAAHRDGAGSRMPSFSQVERYTFAFTRPARLGVHAM